MGCDIHMWAEIRNREQESEFAEKYEDEQKWEKVGAEFDYPYPDEDGKPQKSEQPYTLRNYDLFGMLADVRNGSGFAGCDTGDGCKPILGFDEHSLRGFPYNCSLEVAGHAYKNSDCHSHHYLTLREILDYDWDQVMRNRGFVKAITFSEWHKNGMEGRPSTYCGGVNGEKIKKISIAEMIAKVGTDEFKEYVKLHDKHEQMNKQAFAAREEHGVESDQSRMLEEQRKEFWIKNLSGNEFEYLYTKIDWDVTYRDAAGEDWWNTVEQLKKLGDPEDVRIIFFFDS